MIRHCIICDICGVERKQANHWFAAQQQGGEIRMSAFIPSKSVRPGLKHLCGQTCLHRLVDEYLAGSMGARLPGMQVEERIYQKSPSFSPDTPDEPELPDNAFTARGADCSLYSRKSSYDEDVALDFESSARVIPNAPKVTPEIKAPPESKPGPTGSSAPTAERKLTRPTAAKPRDGVLPTSSRFEVTARDPSETGLAVDTSGLAELERVFSQPVQSPKTSMKPKSVPTPEPGRAGSLLPEPQRPAASNVFTPSATPAAKKLPPTLPAPQKPLSQRSVAGAWERARLWESQSAHQRGTSGKKAQSM